MADLAVGIERERPSRLVAALGAAVRGCGSAAALVGVGCWCVLVVISAALIAPHDPIEQDLLSAQLPPAWMQGGDAAYPLGTDSLGRCAVGRCMRRAPRSRWRTIAASLAAVIGIALGLIAGSLGGWIDQCVSRLIDVWMAFPPVLLSIVLAALIGAGLTSVISAIVVVDWTRFARVIRAETMAQLKRDYAAAARAIGLNGSALLRLEILPNLVPLIVTLLAVEMGIAILVEVILSFVGIWSPATPRPGAAYRRGPPDRASGALDHGVSDSLHHRKRDRLQPVRRRTARRPRSGAAPMTAVLSHRKTAADSRPPRAAGLSHMKTGRIVTFSPRAGRGRRPCVKRADSG